MRELVVEALAFLMVNKKGREGGREKERSEGVKKRGKR